MERAMAETVQERIAELDAFEPTDDVADNDERLQIWVDQWDVTPDRESAIKSMFGLFERYPESMELGDHGEAGPIVHAIEEITGYEQVLAESLQRTPSYYGVAMVKRLLDSNPPQEVRDWWIALLRQIAGTEEVPPVVRGHAQEILDFA